ncbi:MAG: glycosyltransferase family 8 protein [Oscillospiraceae bacterium]|jgi:lipopolysaccharide biosynthesis glycosyltransferase|nr:glycosyltransferase family 8 protein [Oscillospiraceae bacterium]
MIKNKFFNAKYVMGALLSLIFLAIFSWKVVPKILEKIRTYEEANKKEIITETSVKTKIPIVLAFDNNYTCPALVFLQSLLKNANPGTFYEIIILVTNEFSRENKDKISKAGAGFKNFSVDFLDASQGSEQFDDLNIFKERFTKEMFHRLKIPTLIKDKRKCLYLDVDIIVEGDLTELYNEDLNGYLIGGVADGNRVSNKNSKAQKDMEKRKKWLEGLDIDDEHDFVNSGVIVWNLDECRKANLEKKFLEYIKKDHQGEVVNDQDTLNSRCHGRIKDLPLRFNTQTYFQLESDYEDAGEFAAMFGKDVWNTARTKPLIIHYALDKPWAKLETRFAGRWWKYANESPNWIWQEIKNYAKIFSDYRGNVGEEMQKVLKSRFFGSF